MTKWKREVIIAVSLILFSVFGFIYAGTMTTKLIKIAAAKPDVYLRLWFSLLFILSVLMLILALRKKPQEELSKIWSPIRVVTVVLFAVYLLAMPYTGFLVTSLVFMFIVTTIYNLYAKEEIPKGAALIRCILAYAVFSAACTLITYFLFRNILHVNLPGRKLF